MTLAPAKTNVANSSISSDTLTSLHAPSLSLCHVIRAYITRNTINADTLTEQQRLNHFPVAAVCIITWYLQGQAEIVQVGDTKCKQALPCPIVFSGPRSEPVTTSNPGPVDIFILVVSPEALHLLTDIDVAFHNNRSSAFSDVFDTEWQTMAQAVLHAANHEQRIQLLEDFFECKWQSHAPRRHLSMHLFTDLIQGMAVQMLASKWLRSVRQIERQIKSLSGMSFQRQHVLRRAERRFITTRDMVLNSKKSWADIAAETGYADQAHLCRETRKSTGLSPEELKIRIMNDESYWLYRIWL
ncbi:helix-turn-helix domain-containing protein [Undibacterium sp. JH2W]|uniref:helix-turn-helix domain-containing protein n=1 Tax=Undibacterium sp. JH2W TaxID=3413037 RepID=UPI003BF41372